MSLVSADDQVKAYIKKITSQLKDWMYGSKISKLVVVITSKETGEHVERWQFDVGTLKRPCQSAYTDTQLSCKYLERHQNPSLRERQLTRRMPHPSG